MVSRMGNAKFTFLYIEPADARLCHKISIVPIMPLLGAATGYFPRCDYLAGAFSRGD
jgi:hypothetical protein